MRCPKCSQENKDTLKNCRKCGAELKQEPLWRPSWKWQIRTLGIIYAFLLVLFFALNYFLKPYLRQIPKDITPWLQDVPQEGEKSK